MTQLNKKQMLVFFLCPSADMSTYCSARDEWLIMKLCIYVGYHDGNNVSNFGDDPMTQLNFKKKLVFVCVRPKTCRHIARRKLCMYVVYHDANNVSNFGGDPVTQLNLKTFLFMKLGSLLSARCRHCSMKSSSIEGHTSLSTAQVILLWPPCWTPAVGGSIVCPSEDMSPYCSAYDE